MNPNDELNLDNTPEPPQRIIAAPFGEDSRTSRSSKPKLALADLHDKSEVHLTDYLKVLYKRRWMAITAFAVVVGLVAISTFTAIPIYEARTRLLIESDEQNVVSFKQVIEEDQTKQDYYQTQYNVLQSRALARKTLDSLKLWNTPPFGGVQAKKFSLVGTVLGAPSAFLGLIKGLFKDDSVKENAIPAVDETRAQSASIDRFLSRLVVTPVRNSRLVDLKYRLPDASLATSVVNALAKSYIAQNLEYKFMASQEASGWLGERLAEQRKEVEKAELALQRYREQTDAIAMEDTQNIVVQKLTDINAAVTRAKTERIQKEALFRQLQASQSNAATLDTFPAILTNSFIQQQKSDLSTLQAQEAQLSEKLGDKHPEILKLKGAIIQSQRKLDGEIAKVVQSVRSEYLAALAQENSLSSALNQQKGEALAMNKKAIDYGVLQRDVDSTKQIYDSLMQRTKETGVSGELKTSNIRVVDAAEQPRSPVTPRTQRNMLLAFVGGLFLACALVFFFEYLDSRIKHPDEIRVHLGLSHLGLLPSIDHRTGYPLVSEGVPANFSESLRAVRTNVVFSTADEGSRSLVITSTGPGEGKSMVAANLAISLAQAGQRVVLVDADMRKPKAQDIFGISQEPGLSNVLVGQHKASEAVRKTNVPGLWVIPAGRIPPNPSELVGSDRCKELVATLKTHFAWVIIDSPPVMAVTDAALIASYATGVVFVVGAEMTSRHNAKRAVDQLEQVRAHFVGAVLNRVDLQHHGYYYSQYYKREYAQYYAKTS